MSTISIVTPSYNMGAWLRLCVASVADQEGVSIEHLICDGGSVDGTVDWLRNITNSARDSIQGSLCRQIGAKRYTLSWLSEPDAGMYDALNKGLKRAQGDICAHLNGDEQYLPGALKRAETFLARHNDVDIAAGDVIVVDEYGRYLCQRQMLNPSIKHIYIAGIQLLTCGIFFRQRILHDHALFFNSEWRVLADAIWAMDALSKGLKFGLIKQYTSVFSERGTNLYGSAEGQSERRRFLSGMDRTLWHKRHFIVLAYRVKRLIAGHYFPRKTAYRIYTKGKTDQRQSFAVEHPSFRWPTGEQGFWPSSWSVLD